MTTVSLIHAIRGRGIITQITWLDTTKYSYSQNFVNNNNRGDENVYLTVTINVHVQ